jgi:hypothetical protein
MIITGSKNLDIDLQVCEIPISTRWAVITRPALPAAQRLLQPTEPCFFHDVWLLERAEGCVAHDDTSEVEHRSRRASSMTGWIVSVLV